MDNVYAITQDGELIHWGIKGMKWGQRRYQNKDGSLTPAGKKRYAAEAEALKTREKTIKNREKVKAQQAKLNAKKSELDEREKALNGEKKSEKSLQFHKKNKQDSTKDTHKSAKDMSDEELDKAIARAKKEDEYNRLRPAPVPQKKLSAKLMEDVVGPALMNSGKQALEKMITKSVENMLKDKVDPNSLAALEKELKKLETQYKINKYKRGEDPNEKPLSWDDKTKKYDLERKMKKDAEEAAQKEADTKAAEAAARKRKQEYRNATDRMNSSARKDDDFNKRVDDMQDDFDFSDSTKREKRAKGTKEPKPEVTGEGRSKAERFTNSEKWEREHAPRVDVDYEDIDPVTRETGLQVIKRYENLPITYLLDDTRGGR